MRRYWAFALAGLICLTYGGVTFAVGFNEQCTGPFVVFACPVKNCVNLGAGQKKCNNAGPFFAYNAVNSPGLATGSCTTAPGLTCTGALCSSSFYNLVGALTCARSPVLCTENLPVIGGC